MNQRLRWSPPDVVYTPIDVTSGETDEGENVVPDGMLAHGRVDWNPYYPDEGDSKGRERDRELYRLPDNFLDVFLAMVNPAAPMVPHVCPNSSLVAIL